MSFEEVKIGLGHGFGTRKPRRDFRELPKFSVRDPYGNDSSGQDLNQNPRAKCILFGYAIPRVEGQ
jgi:hypothetical protein